MTPAQRWRALKEHWRFKYGPPVVDWLIGLSTLSALQRLQKVPVRILIDVNVLAKGVTHKTGVITSESTWGGQPIEVGSAARMPVHALDDKSEDYANIKYLPGIAHLARRGHLELLSSGELADEMFSQPSGRFRGSGWFDYGIFNDIRIESVDGIVFPTMGPSYLNLPSPRQQRQDRLANSGDELYKALLRRMGDRNSQDAWHIRTAERHGLYCLLTMDYKLRRVVEANKHHEPFRSLTTRVMIPMEFGKEFGLKPVPPHLLSYHNASFPVRSDLVFPSRRRQAKSDGDGDQQ